MKLIVIFTKSIYLAFLGLIDVDLLFCSMFLIKKGTHMSVLFNAGYLCRHLLLPITNIIGRIYVSKVKSFLYVCSDF